MTEATLTKQVKRYLKANGFLTVKLAGGRFQTPGLPDILAVKDGRAYFIELKGEGGKPSALQLYFIEQARNHGATAGVCWSLDDVVELLRENLTGETG